MACGYSSIIPPIDCHKVEKRICSFIKDTVKSAGAKGAVVGLRAV